MLLVRPHSLHSDPPFTSRSGPLTACQPSVPFVFPRLCPDLYMVQTTPVDAYRAVWHLHDIRTVSTARARRALVGHQWHVEGCRRRLDRVRCRSYRLVPEGCLGEGDDWWVYAAQ